MYKIITISVVVLIAFVFISFNFQTNFLSQQKRYKNVRTAYSKKESVIVKNINAQGIKIDELNILITVYKAEKKLNLYVKKNTNTNYVKLTTFSICRSSGDLGPKREQGDYQVPEGYYYINRYNPASSYYLSLGINYPNKSDTIISSANNLGGDIFIHGNCCTIGCLPMTDDKIMEIYLYAINARNNGQIKIPVYIFPFNMTDENLIKYKKNKNVNFWTKLKIGYDIFNKENKELNYSIDKYGNYNFR